MSNWIFTVVGPDRVGEALHPRKIFEKRAENSFWPIQQRTPGRKQFAKGDRVLFYIGRPECAFAGTAVLGSATREVPEAERWRYADATYFKGDYGISLESVVVWDESVSVRPLIAELSFFVNKRGWGGYFQSGVLKIADEDFGRVVSEASKQGARSSGG